MASRKKRTEDVAEKEELNEKPASSPAKKIDKKEQKAKLQEKMKSLEDKIEVYKDKLEQLQANKTILEGKIRRLDK